MFKAVPITISDFHKLFFHYLLAAILFSLFELGKMSNFKHPQISNGNDDIGSQNDQDSRHTSLPRPQRHCCRRMGHTSNSCAIENPRRGRSRPTRRTSRRNRIVASLLDSRNRQSREEAPSPADEDTPFRNTEPVLSMRTQLPNEPPFPNHPELAPPVEATGRSEQTEGDNIRTTPPGPFLPVGHPEPDEHSHSATNQPSLTPPPTFDCSICKEPVETGQTINLKQCGHIFCITCLSEWVTSNTLSGRNTTCPMCRAELITCSRWQKKLVSLENRYKTAQHHLIYRLLGASPPVEATPARHFTPTPPQEHLPASRKLTEHQSEEPLSVEELAEKGLFTLSLADLKRQLYGRQFTLKKYNTNKEFHAIPTLISIALQDDFFDRNAETCFAAVGWCNFILESIKDTFERVSRETQRLVRDFVGYLLVNASLAAKLRPENMDLLVGMECSLVHLLIFEDRYMGRQLEERGVESKLLVGFGVEPLDVEDTTIHIVWSKEL
jgi:hypothetical protein